MQSLLNDLNEAQKRAVLKTEGPVMAIAGAGSGKTTVLTRRIAYLIQNVGVPRNNILAITFTNKAANEMKARIGDLLSLSSRGMWVSTFHAMCARILRQHIEYLGYTRHFQIIDDDDVTQLIKVVMKEQDIDTKLVKPNALKHHVLSLKAAPDALENYEEPYATYLRRVFPAYQKKLFDNNLVDFEDLLILTIRILKEQEEVRKHYHKQFQYILVDEFQDTNDLQYQLISLLANEDENVFIVGDEDQSIYAFRGANIRNIRKFKESFSDVELILLEENYRSTNTILKAANQVISENEKRIEKTLFSKRGEGESIRFFKGASHRDEVEYVGEQVRKLYRQGYAYDDMAILYRTNNTSRLFEELFMQNQIPYKVIGSTSFFKRKEIKDIVAYLRLTINPDDDYSFLRIVNEPRRGIGTKTIERLTHVADEESLSLFSAIGSEALEVGTRTKGKLETFRTLMQGLTRHLYTVDFNTFIDDLLEETGYARMLEHDEQGDIRYENILELKNMFKESERAYGQEDKETLLTYLLEDIALKSQESEDVEADTVSLMTVHAAKGLEFSVVFVAALEQGLFPLYKTFDDPRQLEEERRLFYVAITRAKDYLFFTNAESRIWYGERVSHPDSAFIESIDTSLLKYEGLNRERQENTMRYQKDYSRIRRMRKQKASLDNYSENLLNRGDKVHHKVFGDGVVVSVSGSQCMIAFSKEFGLKTLMKDHPSIVKKEGTSNGER